MKKVAAVTMFFFCVMLFFATPPAFAHNGTTAQDASEGGEGDMRNFLLHLKEHRAEIRTDDGQIEFRNAMRRNNGVWRHGDTYVITVNKGRSGESLQSGDIVFFHAKYPAAGSGSLRHVEIFEQLMTKVDNANGEAVCVQDQSGVHGNHICAVEDVEVAESRALNPFIQIAGFDHELDDVDLSKAEDACPEFTSDSLQSRGWLSADMVDDEKSLVRYLKGVEEHVSEQLSGNDAQGRPPLARMIELMPCWRMLPWESGSIYFYIVTYTDKQYGVFNGLTPQFQDTTLLLIDQNNLNVGQAVLEEVLKEDDTPNEGFLTYLWDNPVVKGDEVVCEETGFMPGRSPDEEKEVFCEIGNPIPGKSPGTSVKRGYFILTTFGVEEGTEYVLGSGIYPRPQEGDSGGGCAIASGNRSKIEVTAFNLFLITALVFLGISRRRRPGGSF